MPTDPTTVDAAVQRGPTITLPQLLFLVLALGSAGLLLSWVTPWQRVPGSPAVVADDASALQLEPFVVNLRGAGGSRLLRLELSLDVERADRRAVDRQRARVRDAVIAHLVDLQPSDVDGFDGVARLRDALHRRIDGALDTPRVRRVYITDLLVQ